MNVNDVTIMLRVILKLPSMLERWYGTPLDSNSYKAHHIQNVMAVLIFSSYTKFDKRPVNFQLMTSRSVAEALTYIAPRCLIDIKKNI